MEHGKRNIFYINMKTIDDGCQIYNNLSGTVQ